MSPKIDDFSEYVENRCGVPGRLQAIFSISVPVSNWDCGGHTGGELFEDTSLSNKIGGLFAPKFRIQLRDVHCYVEDN